MQQALKQRLVGALVILALVVIFLPMLLEGPVERKRVDVPIQVPPEPDVARDNTLPAPDFVERPSPGAGSDERAASDSAAAAETSPNQAVDAGSSPASTDNSSSSQPAEGSDDPTAEQPTDDAASASDTGDQPSSESGAPDGRPGSWVVQVGAFRDASNAERLRQRLMDAGFEAAYRDRSSRGDEVFHRVRLGPQSERAEAEAMLERLKSSLDLDGILVPR